MTINELAAELVIDRTTLGRNIRPLERDGLITITPEPRRPAAQGIAPDRRRRGALRGDPRRPGSRRSAASRPGSAPSARPNCAGCCMPSSPAGWCRRTKASRAGQSLSRSGKPAGSRRYRRSSTAGQHQQDAGLLRAEILAGDDAAVAQAAARGDPAAERPAALHDDDPGLGRALERDALLGRRAARREPGRDQAARPGGDCRVDQRAIGAGIGIDDVDPRQWRGQVERGKWGVGHVSPQRGAVEVHTVAVDMTERAEIERAEGLHPVGRGLDHVAGGMDLVIEDGEHALAARLGRSGDAQRVDQIHPGIGAERARRALRPDQHHRLRDPQGQVQKKPGFLQGRGAVRDHEPGDRGIVAARSGGSTPAIRASPSARYRCCRPGERSPAPGRRPAGSRQTGRATPRRRASARNRDSRAHRGSTRPSDEIVPPVPITACGRLRWLLERGCGLDALACALPSPRESRHEIRVAQLGTAAP